ncbi:MAG: 2Fe-2S iron-sulfur cluster binding domain-containing protein, partial [Anaerolineae bacterium]|nr:2Fe-2S iron-sulfur cluster binding domain-containing protein [Anaerolineae bacterium]
MAEFRLIVNGEEVTVDVEPEMPLLWVLRDILGLTGTKYSCGKGLCGACTVHIDGEPAASCRTRVESVQGRSITTIEGLAPDTAEPLQRAW